MPITATEALDEILRIVNRISGVTLKSVVSDVTLGRLSQRIVELDLDNHRSYLDYMRKNTSEIEFTINLFMNNHTSFFREDQHFTALKRIIPTLLNNSVDPEKRKLRIWSAACSSGEEVYTLAMVLDSCLSGTGYDFEILGTDIDSACISNSKGAVYSMKRIEDIPSGYKEKYFLKGKGETSNFVKVKKSLREKVQFEVYNLNSNRGLSTSEKFDIIFCRNVLIYFSFETCQKIIKSLKSRLKDSGALVLGISEPIHDQGELKTFEPCFYLTKDLVQQIKDSKDAA